MLKSAINPKIPVTLNSPTYVNAVRPPEYCETLCNNTYLIPLRRFHPPPTRSLHRVLIGRFTTAAHSRGGSSPPLPLGYDIMSRDPSICLNMLRLHLFGHRRIHRSTTTSTTAPPPGTAVPPNPQNPPNPPPLHWSRNPVSPLLT